MKFDELLAQQLSMRFAYREAPRASRARRCPRTARCCVKLRGSAAVQAHARAGSARCDEVLRDLAQPHPMQRLLQGDVGSGKTVVAAIAACAAVDAGCQAAVMAPTEILAEQHCRKFGDWLAPLGVQIAWLHGGHAARRRKRARGDAPRATRRSSIGTHALVQEGVEFATSGSPSSTSSTASASSSASTLRQQGAWASSRTS